MTLAFWRAHTVDNFPFLRLRFAGWHQGELKLKPPSLFSLLGTDPNTTPVSVSGIEAPPPSASAPPLAAEGPAPGRRWPRAPRTSPPARGAVPPFFCAGGGGGDSFHPPFRGHAQDGWPSSMRTMELLGWPFLLCMGARERCVASCAG